MSTDGSIGFVAGVEAIGQGSQQDRPVWFAQWAFGARQQHPVLARVIDFIVYR